MWIKPKFTLFLLIGLSLIYFGGLACTKSGDSDILWFPSIVAVDSANFRVFVVSNQGNELNLVDAANNTLVEGEEGEPLLDNNDPQLLPTFPSNAAVAPLGVGLSRIFIIGSIPGANNLITVLDFDVAGGLRLAPFSPIGVAGSTNDSLVGIAVDATVGLVFISNASTGQIHAYDINTGVEAANSPVVVTGIPGLIKVDLTTHLIAIANSGENNVTFLNAADLTIPPQTFDVGMLTRDVALATNAAGSLLFLTGLTVNTAQVYQMDFTTISNSTQIFSIVPPAPFEPIPVQTFLTGTLNQVVAANLPNGQIGGFFTQSSGDLFIVDISSNFLSQVPSVVVVGAATGEGVDLLLNGSGQATQVYYASPGIGALTIVDPVTNLFVDQIQ